MKTTFNLRVSVNTDNYEVQISTGFSGGMNTTNRRLFNIARARQALDLLARGLIRLCRTATVHTITMRFNDHSDQGGAALCNIIRRTQDASPQVVAFNGVLVPPIDVSLLLAIPRVNLHAPCPTLSSTDLLRIRSAIKTGRCPLLAFTAVIDRGCAFELLRASFGIHFRVLPAEGYGPFLQGVFNWSDAEVQVIVNAAPMSSTPAAHYYHHEDGVATSMNHSAGRYEVHLAKWNGPPPPYIGSAYYRLVQNRPYFIHH